jgi:hypothetical protein
LLPETALELLEGLCSPQPAVKEAKEAPAGDRITQGLSAIWSLILQRPPVREACLNMALQVRSALPLHTAATANSESFYIGTFCWIDMRTGLTRFVLKPVT